jgi:hypothetical protein
MLMNIYLDICNPESDEILKRRNAQDSDRSRVCEDDSEYTTQFMLICPDESDHEGGSPLNFSIPA